MHLWSLRCGFVRVLKTKVETVTLICTLNSFSFPSQLVSLFHSAIFQLHHVEHNMKTIKSYYIPIIHGSQ